MKLSRYTLALSVALLCSSAYAQRPGGGPPQGRGGFQGGPGAGGDGFRRGGPGGEFGPGGRELPPNPLIEALDTDGDHSLSLEELSKAVELIKKFDKDENGKISPEEMRPDFPQGRNRGDGAFGRRGGRPGQEREGRPGRAAEGRGAEGAEERGRGRGRPEAGEPSERGIRDRQPEGRGPEGRGGQPGGMMVHPERMHAHALEFDSDEDGKLDSDELKAFIADFAKVHGGADEPRGAGRGRAGGERAGGERPSRPDREQSGGDRPARPKS